MWILDSHIAHKRRCSDTSSDWFVISNVVVPTPKKQKKNEENTLVGLFSHVPVDQVSILNFKHYKDEVPISSRLSARGTSKSLRGLALGWTCRLAPACVKGFLPNTEDYSRDYSRAPLDYGHFFEEQVEGAEV